MGINAGLFPLRDGEAYTELDLNDVADPARRPMLGPYQLVVMAEVLEHLRTAPSIVLPWLASLLAPGGYLIVQTPNAVALPKRLRMLIGKQPFQALSTDPAYPGHYREYTVAELVAEGRAAGFEVVAVRTANYFGSAKLTNRVYQRHERLVPPTLRAGITVIYRRP
jgi:2-polyprenyl-3-methyl-5-hydroxy-6-metoxy-1,4-benzoquinol methylase